MGNLFCGGSSEPADKRSSKGAFTPTDSVDDGEILTQQQRRFAPPTKGLVVGGGNDRDGGGPIKSGTGGNENGGGGPSALSNNASAGMPASNTNGTVHSTTTAGVGGGMATPQDPVEAARVQAQKEEESRLLLILQTAGRGMVSVRSTRGSTVYYDQGFAAALYQHLEQTAALATRTLPVRLPPFYCMPFKHGELHSASFSAAQTASTSGGGLGETSTTSTSSLSTDELATATVYARLSKPIWKNILLGTQQQQQDQEQQDHSTSPSPSPTPLGLAGCGDENPYTYLDQKAEMFLDSVLVKKEHLFADAPPLIENLL